MTSSAQENSGTAEIIRRPQTKAARASEKKWGAAVMKIGFSIVPSLLLRAQRRLRLSPTQLAVLLQICDYWWEERRKPYPSKELLADRLGLSPRQIQRHIAELEEMGLVERIARTGSHGGRLSNTYDLAGLITRLKEIEPDFREVEEEAKKRRKEVARPGFRQRRPKLRPNAE